VFDSFASDGAVTKALTTIAALPESANVPNVFLPSTPSTPRAVKEVVNTVEAKTTNVMKKVETKVTSLSWAAIVKGVLELAESKLPREWKVKEWWTDVSIERQTKACIPEGVLDVIGIDGMSSRIISSRCPSVLSTRNDADF
jgi:nucleoporin NDC1